MDVTDFAGSEETSEVTSSVAAPAPDGSDTHTSNIGPGPEAFPSNTILLLFLDLHKTAVSKFFKFKMVAF